MHARMSAACLAALLALAACERRETSEPPPPATKAPPLPEAAVPEPVATPEPGFVNRVWTVAESRQVSPGEMRVFLEGGTLVMASPNGRPAFGTWTYADGRLAITEEGRRYDVDILELTGSSFRIRIHNPGEPVEILFAPAEQPSLATPPIAARTQAASAPVVLWGTAWRLESLAGAAVLDRTKPTLEFPSEGRASGDGSCNRFNGIVNVADDSTIAFGGVAATRKACPEAVMRQEETYFTALRDVERYETDGQTLKLYRTNGHEPLRFVSAPAAPARAGITKSPASAGVLPTLTGIWTIVDHHLPGGGPGGNDAQVRYGESVRLTARSAISAGDACREPRYSAQRVAAQAYVADTLKLAPGALRPLAGRNQLQVMETSCGAGAWNALGGTLIELDRDRALAPWDGVFFELARDRDFRALGQEPGWQLEIHKGSEMRFTYDYGKGELVTPAARAHVDSSSGTRTYRSVTEANDLEVVIVPVRCADSMSGKQFAATVSVTLNGRAFHGCGEPLATPYQG